MSPTMLLSYHGTTGGSGAGTVATVVIVGLFVTAGWLLISQLAFRTTVLIAAGGWVAALALLFLW